MSMKKSFIWMCAAILTSGMAFTSCANQDYPTGPEYFWEKTTNVIDFEDGTTPFTADSRIDVGVGTVAGWDSKVATFLGVKNSSNGYSFAHYNFSDKVEKARKVIISFDYMYNDGQRFALTIGDALVRTNGTGAGCSGSSRTSHVYGNKGAIFNLGANSANFFVNGSLSDNTINNCDNIIGAKTNWAGQWLKVKVIVYCFEKKVEWSIKDAAGQVVAESDWKVDYYMADANEATQIDVYGYLNYNTNCYIDNLSIESDVDPDVQYVDAKVMYVDAEGNELKEARAISGVRAGTNIDLLESDKAAIFNADKTKKYVYESDNAEATTIDATNNTVTVVFREAEVYYAMLNCMADGQRVAQFFDDSKYWFFEGDNLVIYPYRGYEKGGAYYFTPATDNNGASVTFPGSLTSVENAGKTYYVGSLNYTKDESVVYYSDFERLALPTEDAGNGTGLGQLVGTVNSWYSFSGSYFSRFSGGRGIRLDAGSYVYTEPIKEGGIYTVTIYGRNDKSELCEKPYTLGLRDADGNITYFTDVTIPDWGSATTGTNVVEGVEIPAGSSLVIGNDDAAKLISLDDIKVTKPAEE